MASIAGFIPGLAALLLAAGVQFFIVIEKRRRAHVRAGIQAGIKRR